MIWHTGKESYIDTYSRFCHCSVTLSMCQMCLASFSRISSSHNLTYWYILLRIIHTLYTALYDTYCIHYIYHTCTHCYILWCTVHIYIYTHTLIYSDTTPPHDLLLLHQDIHIIPVYTSPSAMPYIMFIIHAIRFRNRIDNSRRT